MLKADSSPQKKAQLEVEEPPKTLDDLFKKTNATPHIYWLPLTEEQFVAKEAAFEQRQAERLIRMEQRKLKDAELEAEKEARRNQRKIEETRKSESEMDTSRNVEKPVDTSASSADKDTSMDEKEKAVSTPKTFVKNGVIVQDLGK